MLDLRLAARLAVGVDRPSAGTWLTETPGIATGYWKAMKRPARERSSGSASVMSSPLKVIVPSVTSSAGWPMIALASVDLPEPFGPHQRVDLALRDLEVEALEDLLVLGAHVQVADLQLSQLSSVSGVRKSRSALGDAADRLAAGRGPANSTSSASVVPASALVTPPWTRVQSSFVAQAWSPSSLVRAEHPALGRRRGSTPSARSALRAPRPPSSIVISLGRLRQAVAAVGAAGRR